MQHLIDAVRRSVQEKNWYAALSGALALPDIAGKLDGRPGGSQARFVSWFNDYLLPKYTIQVSNLPEPEVYLPGKDRYALRCAYLHEGDFDITGHSARDVLERFHFVVPLRGDTIHLNKFMLALNLQVDCFCEEICAAVEGWLRARSADPAVAAALARLPRIAFIG